MALGCAAVVPLLMCDGLLLWPIAPSLIVRTVAVIWSASLLAFFAGVRRGLSFSEANGARGAELSTMFMIYGLAIGSMLFCSPLIAAFGLGLVGLLDALAAWRGETPPYFTIFRPVQMAVAVLALAIVQIWAG